MTDDQLRWRKSSKSGNQGSCVELAVRANRFYVRDSKLGDGSPVLSFAEDDMKTFLQHVSKDS